MESQSKLPRAPLPPFPSKTGNCDGNDLLRVADTQGVQSMLCMLVRDVLGP
jgi:hypothetical protein